MHVSVSRLRIVVLGTAVVVLTVVHPAAVSAIPLGNNRQMPTAQVDENYERLDTKDASAAASSLGNRVEDLSQRDANNKVFANPDGTWTSETAPGPVHAPDETGRWEAIDTDLVETPAGYVPRNALSNLVVSDGTDNEFATMKVGGESMAWRWPGGLPAPRINGDTATYPDVIENGDLVVTATASGFRHDVVLRERPSVSDGAMKLRIPVVTQGTDLVEDTQGGLSIKNGAGEELINAPPPVMYDATSDRLGEPAAPVKVDVAVTETSTGSTVTLSPDPGFLADPSTIYPVTIDPIYSISADTYVDSGAPNSHGPWSDILRVGTDNGGANKYRTFLKFVDGPWKGNTVTAASLRMFNLNSLTCNGSAVRVQRLTKYYENGSTTWATPNEWTTEGYADAAQSYGASGCLAQSMYWNVTSIVQKWASGGAPNYGFVVKAVNESANSGFRAFRSEDYSDQTRHPWLSVTYNTAPDMPTDVAIAQGAGALDPTAVTAYMSDAESNLLTGTFVLAKSTSPATTIWTSSVRQTTANGTVQTSIPASAMQIGEDYTLEVYSSDALTRSRSNFEDFRRMSAVPGDDDPIDLEDPAPPAMTSAGVDEYELNDLERIALEQGRSTQSVVENFVWQADFNKAVEEASALFPESFAEAVIEDTNTPQAQVTFEGTIPVGAQALFADVNAQVTLNGGAPYSALDMAALVDAASASLGAEVGVADSFEVGFEPITGDLEATVHSPDLETQSAMGGALEPVTANGESATIQTVFEDRPVATSSVLRGGVKIGTTTGGYCTSGFPARDRDTGRLGLITADHCSDYVVKYSSGTNSARTALSPAKTMAGKWGDVQFMPSTGESVGRSFYHREQKRRVITGMGSSNVGAWTCFFGRTSGNGSTCAKVSKINMTVKYKDVAKSYSQIFKIKGGTGIQKGDSGGPAFLGGKALGVVSGYGRTWLGAEYGLISNEFLTTSGMNVIVRYSTSQ